MARLTDSDVALARIAETSHALKLLGRFEAGEITLSHFKQLLETRQESSMDAFRLLKARERAASASELSALRSSREKAVTAERMKTDRAGTELTTFPAFWNHTPKKG